MLRNTFLHIPGIGKITEKRLWKKGIRDWDAAYNVSTSSDFGIRLRNLLAHYIPQSKEALRKKDFTFFNRLLKSGEAWRFYSELRNECVFLLAAHPDVVSIDSPLSLPNGYPNHTVIYRECERALKKVGISVFWCLLPSMRGLTMRGMLLAKKLRHHGVHVIESYSGAAQDILLIPRKKASLEELKWGFEAESP
jgi:hypothetical protein